MAVTRNSGTTGTTGTSGWYLHLKEGVTPELYVFITQVRGDRGRGPPGGRGGRRLFHAGKLYRWLQQLM